MLSLNKTVKSCVPFILFAALMQVQYAHAEQTPLRLLTDKRITTVPYSDSNIVPIVGVPFIATKIIYGDDENVIKIEGGDGGGWTIDKQDNTVYVKPTSPDSKGNLFVTTDKHSYSYSLKVNPNVTPTYIIKYTYPEEDMLQKQGLLSTPKAPGQYNWDYSFNGDKRIVPAHVYDDGQFTYMKLQPNQPVPSVFAVDNTKGEESVVNYRQRGDLLVIQQISPQFTLRSGKNMVASIFNNKDIEKMHRNNWSA